MPNAKCQMSGVGCQGFTLVELIVAAAIIGLITSITMVSWRSAQDSLAVARAAHQVAQDIRLTIGLATGAVDESSACVSGSISGYGVYFESSNPSSYIVFAECNSINGYQAGDDGVLKTVQLGQRIAIRSLQPDPFYITFSPPDPLITIGLGGSGRIVLATQDAPIEGYEFWLTSTIYIGWKSPRMDAYCDTSKETIDCGSPPYFALPADSFPNVMRYDWSCQNGCATKLSLEFKTFPRYPLSKVVTVNAKGVVEVR